MFFKMAKSNQKALSIAMAGIMSTIQLLTLHPDVAAGKNNYLKFQWQRTFQWTNDRDEWKYSAVLQLQNREGQTDGLGDGENEAA